MGPILRARHGRPVRRLCLVLGATCPNRDRTLGVGGCLYCGEDEERAAPPPPLAVQIERRLARLGEEVAIIAYLQDHTATHGSLQRLAGALQTIRAALGSRLVGLAIGTRPDALPPAVLELLARQAGAGPELLVELGLQSANEATLRFVRRLHDVPCFARAVGELRGRGLRVCAHVILGLPTPAADGGVRAEGREEAIASARLLGRLGVDGVKLHHCHVLEGTALAELYRAGAYSPPGLEGYLELAVAFLEHLPAAVEVHRLVGEARPPRLLAPAFTADKSRVVARLRAELDRRGTWQGRRAGDPLSALALAI